MFTEDEVYYDEVGYDDIEEMQVIEEIRIGLMLSEISPCISKKDLKEWFANLQMKKKNFCEDITGNDLMEIAKSCGLKIKEC
ncbi:hypothetical protein RSJ21_00190 (plasmid) [Clostridium botulinum]|uniref:hypothetical protein n=1 Tax=Clostridium botulinum TaxID=1491 RepID=UPI000C790AE2|nr:hypothetical protein [Clostridium botulinum]AUN23756.1 hypothetical protein RSJ21_00190 [Clostridium botulinum]